MSQVPFTIFPAIDLRQGKVVRLVQGDPSQQTRYSDSPADTARRWLDAGACWLHVVNLDGALDSTDSANYQALETILAILPAYGAHIQFGGGLRTLEQIEHILEMGVDRAILGTIVIEKPNLLQQALSRWSPNHIIASIDARDGKVQTHGWQTTSSTDACEVAANLKRIGLHTLVFTDTSRDGLQTGINLTATREIADYSGLGVIASGGVRDLSDIEAARSLGFAGIIVGKALYEGKILASQLFAKK
ncbi:MAG TPA: 1-(5-phosphoribosyl)-5-[(5-phosphoribosylamino)methylideneamino]imidazole-4-carboxamide isomerase [Anaerolineaceae bacterium]